MDAAASRRLLAREVKRVLAERGWTQQEAAQAVGVSREQVARWSSTGRIPVHRLAELAERSGVPVSLQFGAQEEAAPLWARRLSREILGEVASLIRLVAPADRLDALADHLQALREERRRPGDGASAPTPPRPDNAGASDPR